MIIKAHEILEKFGDVGQYAIPALTSGYALISGNPAEALAMGVLGYVQMREVFAIKYYFPRARPRPYVEGRESREDKESFPSSHTGGAFMAVGLAWGLYGAKNPMTITTIALASLVGISRYLSKKHWPTDIIGGALIGGINGFAAAHCKNIFYQIWKA